MTPLLRSYLARCLTPEQLANAEHLADAEQAAVEQMEKLARIRVPSQGAVLRRMARAADKARVRR